MNEQETDKSSYHFSAMNFNLEEYIYIYICLSLVTLQLFVPAFMSSDRQTGVAVSFKVLSRIALAVVRGSVRK